MTLPISQPCLESSELGLTSMVAASARLKFCCLRNMCLLRYPPWTKEMPLRAWGLPGQQVLPGPSPSCPAWSPLGCGHTHPTNLWATSAGACLRQRYPRKPPSTHTAKGLRVTRVGWERGPCLAWGSRVTFLFILAKGQRPLVGVLSQGRPRSYKLCL